MSTYLRDQGVTSNITVFTSIGDGIEFVTRLIVRYCIIERLYLGQGLEVTAELADAITRLYAAVLVYLAAAKRYFQGNLACTCHLVHHNVGHFPPRWMRPSYRY